MRLGCLDASMPRCLDASMPRCLDASMPLCLYITFILLTLIMFVVQVWKSDYDGPIKDNKVEEPVGLNGDDGYDEF
jgi:hypothetical protein